MSKFLFQSCFPRNRKFTIRWLVYAVMVSTGILTLEVLFQGPFIPGQYLMHKKDQSLLRRISEEQDARLPHSVQVVPKIVHFTWGGKSYMRFHVMMCILSSYHFIKPKEIWIWYDRVTPSGEWWDYLRSNITNFDDKVKLKHHPDPTEIFGHKIRIAEHKSDVVRLEVVLKFGGIYLDTDVLTLRSFDELLRHDCTMGLESAHGLCNGVIIAKPNSTFLSVWYEEYRTFNDGQWQMHSVRLPALLANIYPKLCNVLTHSLNRPNWYELEYIYGSKTYNWRQNYAMHLWYRLYNVDHDLESIKTLDSTLGEMFRFIIYGHPAFRRYS